MLLSVNRRVVYEKKVNKEAYSKYNTQTIAVSIEALGPLVGIPHNLAPFTCRRTMITSTSTPFSPTRALLEPESLLVRSFVVDFLVMTTYRLLTKSVHPYLNHLKIAEF